MIDLEKVSIVEKFEQGAERVITLVQFIQEDGRVITENFSKDHPYTLFTALRSLQKRINPF